MSYMKSHSTIVVTLYPLRFHNLIRRSIDAGVFTGSEATGLPVGVHPSNTVARGMRGRSIGAFSRRISGVMRARALSCCGAAHRINTVKFFAIPESSKSLVNGSHQ